MYRPPRSSQAPAEGLRCVLCREPEDTKWSCPGCGGVVHPECLAEFRHVKCPTLGCGVAIPRALRNAEPRRRGHGPLRRREVWRAAAVAEDRRRLKWGALTSVFIVLSLLLLYSVPEEWTQTVFFGILLAPGAVLWILFDDYVRHG